MAWTKDQAKAIEARDCNLLVSAAAGSGKTAVLVERIIGMLVRDGIDIDRLLVVTFTQAAAAEMRERISRALMETLNGESGQEERLRRQLNLLNRASISTIHAFCTDMVRSHFHLIDIDPHFRIADAIESELIKLETAEELMEREYEKAEPAFLGLVERFGGSRSDQGLQDILLQTFNFVQSQPRPLGWLQEKVDAFNLEDTVAIQTNLIDVLKRQIDLQLLAARDRFVEAMTLCRLPGGPAAYIEAIDNDIAGVEALISTTETDFSALFSAIEATSHLKLNAVNRDADPELARQAKELRDEGKSLVQEIRSGFLSKPLTVMREETTNIYPYLSYLNEMVASFGQAFQAKKTEKGLVDFNDLEHFALDILEYPEVCREYRERFDYVFVDEYQDSNLVQENIINAVKRDDNLFLVGDVKQSIYRFRLADPTLFLDKQSSYGLHEWERDRRIDLKTNYRSRGEILAGVNYLFKNVMSADLGEIDYDEMAELRPGLESPTAGDDVLEFCLVEKNGESIDGDDEEIPLDHIQIEAEWVGRRIRELMEQEIWDAKQNCYRLPEYRDIVILLRSTRRWAPVFAEILMAQGLPVYADTGTGYFASVEVSVFLNLLRLIDNRYQDIPLLSVMRSPLAGFALDDLIAVRVEDRSIPFYSAVELYTANHEDELSSKLKNFMQKIMVWKEESRWLPIAEFLWKLLLESGYYYYTGAMPGGEQRQANLRILVDRARQFEDTSMRGLFQFLRFVERLQTGSGDMGMAKILGENDNVVRIMSIHKSKGLEFPVVIIAGLGQQFNQSDSNDPMLLHRDLGLGPRYINPDTRTITDTVARSVLQRKIRLESLSEEMRILYVAMTRAEAKLIIFGTCADLDKRCRKWCRTPGTFTLARARNCLDWLGPFLIRHQDGAILRQLAEASSENLLLTDDISRWQVRVLDRNLAGSTEADHFKRSGEFRAKISGEVELGPSAKAGMIRERLDWQYPYLQAEIIPSKISVTQIRGLEQQSAEQTLWKVALRNKPAFLEKDRPPTAAEKGTIMHMVMQYLDFSLPVDDEHIKSQINDMVEREIIRQADADLIEIEKINAFFRSSLGRRVLESSRNFRERPFNLLCRASEILPEVTDSNENLMVQGVIDLYFEEADGIVLVDYKSGYIASEENSRYSRSNIINRYRSQIHIYRQALEAILGKRVKESYVYLFAAGEAVLVE